MRWFWMVSSITCLLPLQTLQSTLLVQDKSELKVLTPSLQERKIQKAVLNNGLKVLLISDPGAQESAAALSVHIGSWADPKEYPGMAHFLEHMLFMGTKAYPDENAFSKYIAEHGGVSNAYTSLDRTVYSFTSNHESFSTSLDMFSHFFIDPLFKASEVGRELHAIDQEHAKNIHHDFRRQWMIFKELGNPDHPNAAFATGCAKTLGHVPRESLISWYEKNYSSDLMHLVVCSTMSIENQLELVSQLFSDVKKREAPARVPFAVLTSQKQFGSICYIKPVKDLKLLSLDWELPKASSLNKEAFSPELIALALSDPSQKGLCEHLKRKHWIEGLQAGVSNFSHENRFISLSLSLTKEGMGRLESIIEECFAYIHLLKDKGIPSYVFDEMKSLAWTHFSYQSREKAFEYVTKLADELIDEPLESYPQKTILPSTPDSKEVELLLNEMKPRKTLLSVLASPELTGAIPTHQEKWNEGEYAVKTIDSSILSKWEKAKPSEHLELPQRNPYISSHLVLSSNNQQEAYPVKIMDNPQGSIYFWQDHKYLVPELDMHFAIKTPSIQQGATSFVLLDLFIKTFFQQHAPLLAQAEIAGLNLSIEPKSFSLLLKIKGYSEKAPEFLLKVLDELKHLHCSRVSFELYKESLLCSYNNQRKSQPYQQAGEYLSSLLYNDAALSEEKSKTIAHLSYEEFLEFKKHLFDTCYIEALLTGNISKDQAQDLSQKLATSFSSSAFFPKKDHLHKQVLVLQDNQGPYKVCQKIDTLGNATLLALWQGTFSYEKKATQILLSTLLSDHFFTTLRSQQQTGYITASWAREVEEELLQFFIVQSATHQPEDLLARFELFLEGYTKDFSEKITEERFNEVKKNTLETLSQEAANLAEQSDIFFHQAFERKGLFTFKEELKIAVDNLDYSTFKQISLKSLSRKNTHRLAVLVEGELQDNPFIYQEVSLENLKEKARYVSSSPQLANE